NYGSPQSEVFASGSEGQMPTDSSALFLERAFMNYSITDSLVFTMGRLPTIDGPNKHIALNQQLMGNYPTLAYSAILDGFGLTKSYNLEDSRVLRLKAIYTPGQSIDNNGPSSKLTDGLGREINSV